MFSNYMSSDNEVENVVFITTKFVEFYVLDTMKTEDL